MTDIRRIIGLGKQQQQTAEGKRSRALAVEEGRSFYFVRLQNPEQRLAMVECLTEMVLVRPRSRSP
jgi:hypothetical protein